MKRILIIAVVLFLLTVPALAETPDWNSMSIEELQNSIRNIHSAIASKNLDIDESKVIIDQDTFHGYQLSLGKVEWNSDSLTIGFTIINDSPYTVKLMNYDPSINGWHLAWNSISAGETLSGERSKNTAKFTLRNLEDTADVSALEDIDIIRIQLSLLVTKEDDSDYVYCAFYLVGDGEGGFVVSSAKFSETYTQVETF